MAHWCDAKMSDRRALNRERQRRHRERRREGVAVVPVQTTGRHLSLLLRLGRLPEGHLDGKAYDDAMSRAITELLDDLAEGKIP